MSITGRIKTLFFDKNNSEAIFPRTKVKAVSDDENRGLDFLLENIDTQLLNLQGQVNSKAPTGYGLGTEAQFISSNELLSDYSNTGFYRWSAENIDPNKPFSSGEMLAIKRSDGYGQQIAFRADSLQPEIKIRKKTDNKWSDWENWGPSSFAPSGYGLGKLINYSCANDTDIDNTLISVINSLGEHSFKRIVLSFTTTTNFSNGGGHYYADIYKLSTNYAVITIKSYIVGGREMRRIWFSGKLEPWEWVNPPLVVGQEYRTTQRYEGKPVYIKTINFGTLPATGTTNVSTGISGGILVKLTGTFFETGGASMDPYPLMSVNAPKCICWTGSGCSNLRIQAVADCSKYTGKFIIEYTKN